MIRKLKTLSVALFAVLVLSAVAASAAMAEGDYTAASYPTTMTATSAIGNDVFTTEAGSSECAWHFEASLNEASSDLTVKAKTTSCKAFGFVEASVNMNSCDYTFTTPSKIGTPTEKTHEWTIPVDIACTGAPIKIVSASCEVTIGAQSLGGHVIATATTNTPTQPDDLDIRSTLTGISYTVVKDGFLCPFAGTGVKTGATLTQSQEITLSSTNGKSITIS